MTREELLQKVAYYIDVWVPVYDSNYNIFYYISWAFLIDRFIAWKWETYIWIWLLLQVLVFVFYWFILFYFAKFISKWKFNKKIVISFIIILLILLLSYLLLFNKGIF